MTLQFAIVLLIILTAVLFVGIKLLGKRKAFSKGHGCGDDCGCGK